MKSVQKFILSTTLFLLCVIAGTHDIHAETMEHSSSSASFYQQQETPFEKTMHFLYMNGIADLPQPPYSSEVSANTLYKPLFSPSSDSNNLYHTAISDSAAALNRQQTYSSAGIAYYIYTLRRILI